MPKSSVLNGPKTDIEIELVRIFGEVRNAKDWHRISEGVARLNKLGRSCGVRLELEETGRRLLIKPATRQQLQKFQSRLSRGIGAVQRTLALTLGEKIVSDPSSQAAKLRGFVDLQLQELSAWMAKPLQFALGISIDSLFIDSPYASCSTQGAQGPIKSSAYGFLRAELLRAKTFHGLVTGDPGSGKTTLLYKLFQELCHLYLAEEISSLPVFIPASHAEIREGRLCWWMGNLDPYLRENPEIAKSIHSLELSGKVIFLIDGLDENPDLVDFSRIEVLKAWQKVLKSRYVLSCRSRFYVQYLEGACLENKLGKWSTISLVEWRHTEAQALYRQLAASALTPPTEVRVTSAQLKAVFAHLGNLSQRSDSVETLCFHKTPLNLWFYALFVASNRGLFPRNEYELLEFVFNSICQWQAAKKGRLVPFKAVMGILTRMAWQGYVGSHSRDRRCTQYGEIAKLLEEHRPELLAKKEKVIAELEANPILESDPENGILWIDSHFMDFLAARQLIQALLLQDIAQVMEQFSKPVLWDVSLYLDEGVEMLPQNERRVVSATFIHAFEACKQAFDQSREFSRALALNQIAFHIGMMEDSHGREFLRQVLESQNSDLVESCYRGIRGIEIGLALSGDSAPLVRYVEKMERDRKLSRLNLAACQAYALDKKIPRGDLESFFRKLSPVWDKSCDMLLNRLDSRAFKNIQILNLFSFRSFLEELGSGPLLSERGSTRKDRLQTILPQIARQNPDNRPLHSQIRHLHKALSKIDVTSTTPGTTPA